MWTPPTSCLAPFLLTPTLNVENSGEGICLVHDQPN